MRDKWSEEACEEALVKAAAITATILALAMLAGMAVSVWMEVLGAR